MARGSRGWRETELSGSLGGVSSGKRETDRRRGHGHSNKKEGKWKKRGIDRERDAGGLGQLGIYAITRGEGIQ